MNGLIGTFTSMSLVASSLLAMQYVFVSWSFRPLSERFSVRPLLIAIGWLLISAYLILELALIGKRPAYFLEVLSLSSTVLFCLSALPVNRPASIGIALLIFLSLLTFFRNPPLAGGLLATLSCCLMAFGFHYILPRQPPHALYLAAKISLLSYLALASIYTIYAAVAIQGRYESIALAFMLSLGAKLVHIGAVMGLLLEWMARRGAESEAQASIARQRQFIAEVAHELQTPIAELQLRLSTLRDQSRDAAFAMESTAVLGVAERIAAIVGGAWRYLAGIGTTLEDPRTRREVVDINALIEAAYLSLRSTTNNADRVAVARSYSRNVRIQGSPSELVQLFLNVLRNAVEAFSDFGGTIHIKTSHQGDKIAVDLQDTGKGIDPASAVQAFDAGFSTKSGSGRGYGLTVAKRIAETHGGTLELVDQDTGRLGAHLRLLLPSASPSSHKS